jgi:hypothetical protein
MNQMERGTDTSASSGLGEVLVALVESDVSDLEDGDFLLVIHFNAHVSHYVRHSLGTAQTLPASAGDHTQNERPP